MPTSPFDAISKKVAGKPSAATLAAAFDDLVKVEDKLQGQHAEIAQHRSNTLLTADEASLAKSRAALGAIGDQLEVAAAFRIKLTADHAAALAAEEQTCRHESFDAAMVKVAGAKTFARDYSKAARAMVAAMTTLMEAKLAADAANSFLPEGVAPIIDHELALNSVQGEAREVLKEDTIELWCFLGTWNPVAGQDRVASGARKPIVAIALRAL